MAAIEHFRFDPPTHSTYSSGRLDSVDWNGGMEWNSNKLDTSDLFSPSYNDHL